MTPGVPNGFWRALAVAVPVSLLLWAVLAALAYLVWRIA